MQRQKTVISIMVTIAVSCGFLVTGARAQIGSLEPPPSAVDGAGNPVATTQTQLSWDQGLPAAERFVLVMGGAAVLDKNTGLVWEQAPPPVRLDRFGRNLLQVLVNARFECLNIETGGQRGWRVPSVPELMSLLVPDNPPGGPDLPIGHPFSNIQSSTYWSVTANVDVADFVWAVDFSDASLRTVDRRGAIFHIWCVRSGGSLQKY